MKKTITFLSLFSSSATLICCALPALLVALGAGAAVAGLVGSFPQLIWFSDNKALVFGIGALLLIAAGAMRWYSRDKACPIDDNQAEACRASKDYSRWIFLASVGIYMVGAFFAFAAPLIL